MGVRVGKFVSASSPWTSTTTEIHTNLNTVPSVGRILSTHLLQCLGCFRQEQTGHSRFLELFDSSFCLSGDTPFTVGSLFSLKKGD